MWFCNTCDYLYMDFLDQVLALSLITNSYLHFQISYGIIDCDESAWKWIMGLPWLVQSYSKVRSIEQHSFYLTCCNFDYLYLWIAINLIVTFDANNYNHHSLNFDDSDQQRLLLYWRICCSNVWAFHLDFSREIMLDYWCLCIRIAFLRKIPSLLTRMQ